MPCQDYDSRWRDSDDSKLKEMKKHADMLARIACKAMTELEKNQIEDLLLLKDDEVRTWWSNHKINDARAKEAERAAREKARQTKLAKQAALAKLSAAEKVLLGLEKR